ncbi:hypothetical protein LEP1GSC086_1496 [Leptospira weilii str. LNT 1234]|nr:hypothetical protein LEP1GSC086_1496 [Leptospira weilii str. LNT 1234]
MNFQEKIRKPVFNFGKNPKPISKTDSIGMDFRIFQLCKHFRPSPSGLALPKPTQLKKCGLEFYPNHP